MNVTEVFAGLVVSDYEEAAAWYERFFGRKPDLVPNDKEAAWQSTDTGWIYLLADADRAGRGVVTLLLDDLDGMLGELAERGVSVGPIETLDGGARKVVVTDPDGNKIAIAQVKP
jgi:catechol 2,3-dioxygenase-like lactoylglutathione lyase family enzyme